MDFWKTLFQRDVPTIFKGNGFSSILESTFTKRRFHEFLGKHFQGGIICGLVGKLFQ